MKKKLSIRQRLDRYFLTLESRGRLDPIFFIFLLYQMTKITCLVVVVYAVYRMVSILLGHIQ